MPFVTFGGLAGWLHPVPPDLPASDMAAVLCSPLGDDVYATFQGWRLLAEMLAARGIPTLRFDWPGTGDSAGVLPCDGVMADWINSIGTASDYVRQATGATHVALVGLRLGAVLAARAAGASPIAALALLAPVTGKQLMRELRLVHQVATLQPGLAGAPLDVAGLTLTAATVADIQALIVPDHLACPRILAVQARPAAVPDHAMSIPFEGYDAFFQDNLNAVVPEATLAHVAAWLDQPGPRRVVRVPDAPPASLVVPGGVETPVWFGPDRALFGVVCTPSAPRPDAPATVLLSSGATHHVGNGRINVLLARHLVQLGVTTVRMAMPGSGENRDGNARHPYAPDLGTGLVAALDWLEGAGYRRFAAFGLCSGGYVALHAARTEPRLSALLLLNVQVFDWRPGDSLAIPVRAQATYIDAVRNGQVWRRMLGRDGERLTVRRGVRVVALLAWRWLRGVAGRLRRQRLGARAQPRTVVGWLRQLGGGGCRVMLAWGNGDPGLDGARAAFGPRLRRLSRVPGVSAAVLPGTHHIVNGAGPQTLFLALASDFLLAEDTV